MKENNLLASIALFSELYNNNKNIYDIIALFIESAVNSEKKWTISSTELTKLLEDVYDFKIPESVIRTTVKSKLKDIVEQKNGYYYFTEDTSTDQSTIEDNLKIIGVRQQVILSRLLAYIGEIDGRDIDDKEQNEIITDLHRYILENGVTEKYGKYISAFVISNQNDPKFIDDLNLIREGVILYQGIRYTADLNELGSWNTNLTIFLSTEHLLNALGYNGSLYHDIFNDFYSLVNEVNLSNQNRGKTARIRLRYFEETREEITSLFKTAEFILARKAALDPTKQAMHEILHGCKTPADIQAKHVRFERDLQQKGIVLDEGDGYKIDHSYYVYDSEIISNLKTESINNRRNFDEDEAIRLCNIFTKINALRGGNSRSRFENVGHIFVTASSFALYLAHNTKVKFNEEDIPFAKDIDYIINKLWFKLKKGFGDRSLLPKSFSVVTKAQIILSSQINNSVSVQFQELQKEYLNGSLTKEEALDRNAILRERPNKPEDISIDNIEKSLAFLNDENLYEDLVRQKEKDKITLAETQKKASELERELQRRDKQIQKEKEEKARLEYNSQRNDFTRAKWVEYVSEQRRKTLYFFATSLTVVAPLIINAIPNIYDHIRSVTGNSSWVLPVTIIISVVALVGRSFIFNKERIKEGWEWLLVELDNSKLTSIRKSKTAVFEAEFDGDNDLIIFL